METNCYELTCTTTNNSNPRVKEIADFKKSARVETLCYKPDE